MKAVSQYVRLGVGRSSALVAYRAGADVVGKAVTLLVTVAAARVLAPEAFGVLTLAMTTGWILGVASDAGLPLYLARAVARVEGAVDRVVRDVMRFRVQLALGALGVGLVISGAWAPRDHVVAFAVIVAAYLAGAVLDTLAHVYRGLGRSEIDSTLTIVTRLSTAALVVIVLVVQPTLLLLSAALLVSPVAGLIASSVIAARLTSQTRGASASAEASASAKASADSPEAWRRRSADRLDPPPHNRFTFADFKRDAAPIGVGILLSAIYFRCDVYFVSYWHGLETVGMYNAVFRIVEAMRLLPAAALAVVFPELCRATDARPLRRLALTLTCAGAFLMGATFYLSPAIVGVVYGAAYLPATPALRVLALALPLFFLNYALTHQVIGWDGQRAYAAITGAALVANVVANVLLIPPHGMVGAAWATLLTELVVTGGCVMALQQAARPLFRAGSEHKEPGPFVAQAP